MLDSVRVQYYSKNGNNRIYLNVDKRQCGISSAVMDKIADEKLSGNYGKRNEMCSVHFIKKSVNGKCIECE